MRQCVGHIEEEGFVCFTLLLDPVQPFLGKAVMDVGFAFGGIVGIVLLLFVSPNVVWIKAVGT